MSSTYWLSGLLASVRVWLVGYTGKEWEGDKRTLVLNVQSPFPPCRADNGLVCSLTNSQLLPAPVTHLSPTPCRHGMEPGVIDTTLSFRVSLHCAQLWNNHLTLSVWYKDVTSVWKRGFQGSKNPLSHQISKESLSNTIVPPERYHHWCRQNTMTCGHTSEGTLVRLRFLGAIWGQNLCPSPLGHPGEVLSSHSATKSRKNLEAGLLLDPNTRLQWRHGNFS